MAVRGQGFDAASAAGQHQAVDDGTGPRSVHGVAEQPGFSVSGKNSDIAFKQVVVDRHPAFFCVARQVFPLVQGVGHGIADLAVGQDLRRYVVEPCLESVQDGHAMMLAETANAIGLCFTLVRFFVPRLAFNPVELFKELERLLRRTAAFLSCLEGIDEATPRMGQAS